MINKSGLVDIIAKQQGTTKKDAAKIISAFEAGVKGVLTKNEDLSIMGFIKFTSEFKEAKQRVLGFTGETIEVPAHYVHKAKLSPHFVD